MVAEHEPSMVASHGQSGATKHVQVLQSIEPVLELLSDITAGVWRQGQASYLVCNYN